MGSSASDQEHTLSNLTSSANTRHPRRLDEVDVDSTASTAGLPPSDQQHPISKSASSANTRPRHRLDDEDDDNNNDGNVDIIDVDSGDVDSDSDSSSDTSSDEESDSSSDEESDSQPTKPKRRLVKAAKLAWNKFQMDPKVQNVPDFRQYSDCVQVHLDALEGLTGLHKGPLRTTMKAVQQLFVKKRDWPISCGSAAKMRTRLETFFKNARSIIERQDRIRASIRRPRGTGPQAATDNRDNEGPNVRRAMNFNEKARLFCLFVDERPQIANNIRRMVEKSDSRAQMDAPRAQGGGVATFQDAVAEIWRQSQYRAPKPRFLTERGHVLAEFDIDPNVDIDFDRRSTQLLKTVYNRHITSYSLAKQNWQASGEGDDKPFWDFCKGNPIVLLIHELREEYPEAPVKGLDRILPSHLIGMDGAPHAVETPTPAKRKWKSKPRRDSSPDDDVQRERFKILRLQTKTTKINALGKTLQQYKDLDMKPSPALLEMFHRLAAETFLED